MVIYLIKVEKMEDKDMIRMVPIGIWAFILMIFLIKFIIWESPDNWMYRILGLATFISVSIELFIKLRK